jgi:hypothetical protein
MKDTAEEQGDPASSVDRQGHLDPAPARTDLKHHQDDIENPKDENHRNTPDLHFEPLDSFFTP